MIGRLALNRIVRISTHTLTGFFWFSKSTTYNTINQIDHSSMQQKPAYLIHENNTALFSEGRAKIYTKYLQKNQQGQTIESEVFYNPVQVFNRDFSVLVMQGFINRLRKEKGEKFEGATIVDALSASGLRTIRYVKELQGVKKIIANDILPAAHKLMKDNFELNEMTTDKYELSLKDANVMLRQAFRTYGGFDIIDLDPYGSVVPFLEAAMEATKEGGMLCITCTDTRVLCGPDLAKCFYFYGSVRAKVHDFNENALRILLYTVSSAASRHCKYIKPLLSLQTDFYVRVFVQVRTGRKECGQSATKIGNIFNCQFCGNYSSQSYFKSKNNQFVPQRNLGTDRVDCEICSHPLQLNGPVWLDKLNDSTFVEELTKLLAEKESGLVLATQKKIFGVLHGILAEGEMALKPLAFNLDLACKTVHSTGLSRQALLNSVKSLGAEHIITPSYLSPGHYKTDLPMAAIYDIIKAWKLRQLGEQKYLSNVKQEHAVNILKNPPSFKPDFDFKSEEKIETVPRFISLGKGLGPKGKAGKRVLEEQQIEESKPVKKREETKELKRSRSKKEEGAEGKEREK